MQKLKNKAVKKGNHKKPYLENQSFQNKKKQNSLQQNKKTTREPIIN